MSEEEKEAIETLEKYKKAFVFQTNITENDYATSVNITKNLIDRLQKELEQEKEKNKELQKYMKEYLIPKSTINLVYVSKDKIKDKIKNYDDMIQATYNDTTHQGDIRRDTCREIKVVLEDLLKENLDMEIKNKKFQELGEPCKTLINKGLCLGCNRL